MQIKIHNKRVARLVALGVFFAAVCLFYLIRLAVLELDSEHIAGNSDGGYDERTVIVQAVRGQIYDRNGKLLVGNEYTYDFTVDYSVFPTEASERNRTVWSMLTVIDEHGEADRLADHDYPFVGSYPGLGLSDEAKDPDSGVYDTLVKFYRQSGLRTDTIEALRASSGMSAKDAEAAYDADPLAYIKPSVVVEYLLEEYGLDGKSSETGEPLYSRNVIDRLLRVYWGMESTGFSRANDYVLAEDVSMSTITDAKEQGIAGVNFTTTVERVYLYPGYASHILGQTGPIYAEEWAEYKELGYNMNALVGKSGCEAAFEEYLHGRDGVKVIVEDRGGNVVKEYMKTEPVAGKDVYLTIDIELQIAAEDGLRENVKYVRENLGQDECEAGALSAVDPKTGEVLALASYPSYDLSTFGLDYDELAADSALPLYNRALQGVYAPGSTMKPGVSAAVLTESALSDDDDLNITLSTKLECAGVYTYYQSYQPKCWIHNATGGSHGWVDTEKALEVSCNCFYYEAGRQLGIERMNAYCTLFGLGQPTGIELGESTGILAGPAWREANKQKAWQATDTIAAAIGQSDNAFTPLQLSVYIAALTNGGTRYAAHLLHHVEDVATKETVVQSRPEVLSSVAISETHRDGIIDGMERVISTSGSISRWMRNVPVTVAGKTGTAQVGGKADDNGLFVCCAPSSAPDIAVASVVEHAGGGSYAALAAARVLEAFYEE